MGTGDPQGDPGSVSGIRGSAGDPGIRKRGSGDPQGIRGSARGDPGIRKEGSGDPLVKCEI